MTRAFTAVSSLSTLIPLSMAFQPLPFLPQLSGLSPGRFSQDSRATAIMRYQSPWDLATNSANRKRQTDDAGWSSTSERRSPFETLPFSLPGIFHNSVRIGDPVVCETRTRYTLTFNMPAEVKHEDLDVSISGRILTLEARVTREMEADERSPTSRVGWVKRSCSTHSCARSFVLPNGMFSHDVNAHWAADGTFKIVLEKGDVDAGNSHVQTGTAPGLADAAAVPVKRKDDNKMTPSSVADDYLSRLTAASPPCRSRLNPWAELTGSSLLPTLDDDFRNFGKNVFNHYGLRFPTEDQVAATVAKAREERARRVTAIKRSTMATDVSESKLSYVVRFALPEGATRSNVMLTVTPDKAIRVNFSPHGRHSVSKYVRLPWDVEMSEISARFQDDESTSNGEGSKESVEESVSSLTVTVGRKAPLSHPYIIDIE